MFMNDWAASIFLDYYRSSHFWTNFKLNTQTNIHAMGLSNYNKDQIVRLPVCGIWRKPLPGHRAWYSIKKTHAFMWRQATKTEHLSTLQYGSSGFHHQTIISHTKNTVDRYKHFGPVVLKHMPTMNNGASCQNSPYFLQGILLITSNHNYVRKPYALTRLLHWNWKAGWQTSRKCWPVWSSVDIDSVRFQKTCFWIIHLRANFGFGLSLVFDTVSLASGLLQCLLPMLFQVISLTYDHKCWSY